jgi:hypothetical protein
LRPEAWQELLHAETDTANRMAADTRRGNNCEPAAGWRIRRMADVGLTPVPDYAAPPAFTGGAAAFRPCLFLRASYTALQAAETLAAYHGQRVDRPLGRASAVAR